MKRRTVLMLILLTETVCLVSSLNKTVYTYYGDQAKMTWQSAVAFCQERGQNMVSPSTQLHTDILNGIATQADGKPWYNKIQDTWISLHDPNVTTPGVGYQWLMRANNTCAPLGVWSNWYQGLPQNTGVNQCVKATWISTGFQWVTEQCSVTLRVMCVSSAGSCLFSDGWANSTINTDSLAVVTSARTSVACIDLCHNTAAFGLDCWAVEWTSASSNCTLRMSDRPFNNSNLNFSMGTTVFPATCHVGVYDETTKPLVSTNLMYDPPCTEGSAPSEASATDSESSGASRGLLSMTYFPVMVTWSVAGDVCQALSTPGSQAYRVMPTNDAIADTVISLLQNSTIPKVWLGDLLLANQDNALWLDESANISSSCVSVTYHVTSGLQRESESCLLPQAAVLCQKLEKNNCTFRTMPGMAISSDWVLGPVRSVNECLNHCNNYYYKSLECWAVTINNRTKMCYLFYARAPVADDYSQVLKVGANYLVLYIRTCFRTSIYDFSSTLINSLLYPDNSSLTFLLPSTDSIEVISEVELSGTPLHIMVSVVEEVFVVTVQVDVETKVDILATSVFELGTTEALPFESIKDTTRLQTTTNNPTTVANTTWNSLTAVKETTSVTTAATTTTITARNISIGSVKTVNTTSQAANASVTNGTTLMSSNNVTKAIASTTVTSASGVTQTATYDYTNASQGQTSTNTSASSDIRASAAVSTTTTEASAKMTYVAIKTTTQTLEAATTQVELLPSTGMFAASAASTSAFAATKPFQTVGVNFLIPSYQNVQQGQTKNVTSPYVAETTSSKQTDQWTSILQLLGATTPLPPSSAGGIQQGAGQTTFLFSSLAYFNQTSSSGVDHSTAGYGNEAVTRELSATPAMSTESSSSTGDAATLCACYAFCAPTETFPDSNSSLQDLLEDMLVDYKSTSRSRRKLVSVQDDRPSARMLGSMGTAILLSVASLVLALDLCSLGRWLANRK